MPANILNLPSYVVSRVEENDHDYHVYVSVKDGPQTCPKCGGTQIVGFGRHEQVLRDLPMHGKRVGIYVDTRRFRCRGCGVTFYEALPEVDEKRLMTRRLVKWIGQQSIKRTFAAVAEDTGVTDTTVKSVFRDHINELERTVRFETPKWMGIDEIHLIRPRCVISNIQNNTIVNMLPNRDKKTVTNYLFGLEGKETVQYVAMDMWTPYRDAVHAVLPEARVIIDKFHVVRMANDALERVRKGLRERLTLQQRRGLMHDRFVLLKRSRDLTDKDRLSLSGWTRNYPALGEAYGLKETFFAIYEGSRTADEARRRYDAWSRSIPPEIAPAFADLTRAWSNWEPYILSYFDHPITNAYTESLNNLIRLMDRLGRGYSFEALRAKILFAEGAHKHKATRPKFERRRPEPTAPEIIDAAHHGCQFFGLPPEPENPPRPHRSPEGRIAPVEKNYGADIATLIELLESGRL